jgi:hypothetical protein
MVGIVIGSFVVIFFVAIWWATRPAPNHHPDGHGTENLTTHDME